MCTANVRQGLMCEILHGIGLVDMSEMMDGLKETFKILMWNLKRKWLECGSDVLELCFQGERNKS